MLGDQKYQPVNGGTSAVTIGYTYDAADRLTKVANTQTNQTTYYTYDGQNHRVAMNVTSGGATVNTNYLVDPSGSLPQALAEYPNVGLPTYYIPAGTLIGQDQGGTAGLSYFATDGLGSIRATFNTSGTQTGLASYDPYGKPLPDPNQPGVQSHLGYTGALTDANGLVYLNARYYNPGDGQFLSSDPMAGQPANPGTFNLYGYVMGNPIIGLDPSGKMAIIDDGMPNDEDGGGDGGGSGDGYFSGGGDSGPSYTQDNVTYNGDTTTHEYTGTPGYSKTDTTQVYDDGNYGDSYSVTTNTVTPDGTTDTTTIYSPDGTSTTSSTSVDTADPELAKLEQSQQTANDVSDDPELTKLYRTVGTEEYEVTMKTGEFSLRSTGPETKQFGLSFEETLRFADTDQQYVAVLQVEIPSSAMDLFDPTHVDEFIFKSGTLTVEEPLLDLFNSLIQSIVHVF